MKTFKFKFQKKQLNQDEFLIVIRRIQAKTEKSAYKQASQIPNIHEFDIISCEQLRAS